MKHDLERIIALFKIEYFVHNIEIVSTTRKCFRPKNSDDETKLADQTDYVWDSEWSHKHLLIYQPIYQVQDLLLILCTKIM